MFTRALALVIGLSSLAMVWQPSAGAAPERAARDRAPGTPLVVSIDTLTPAHVPEDGPIRIRGRVTNRDDVPWSTINVYPFVADTPIRTRSELADAATAPVDLDVGGRITDVGDRIEVLQPGASSTFSITVPRSVLLAEILAPAEPGVYWFGVHAIGTSDLGRDEFADGRARTFLPLVPPATNGEVPTALVVPLRRYLGHDADGSLSEPEEWQHTLSPDGRLREAVEFGAAAGPGQVSWLVDPALPDAVRRLADGNLPRSLDPTEEPVEPGETPTDTPTEEGEENEEAEPEPPTPEQQTAETWLTDLESALRSQGLLTLPYGDIDLAAAADHDPALIDLARTQVGATLQEWGLTGTPVVGSPAGYLDPGAIEATDPASLVLLSDQALLGEAPGVADLDGRTLVIASSGASSGGPAPGNRYAGVALRQRILSEAALRALTPGRRDPLVVIMPAGLSSFGADAFFAGLDVDWVDLTTVTDATEASGPAVGVDDLVYPARQNTLELDPETLEAVDDLIADGETLQNLLTRNTEVAAAVTEQALTGASYTARRAQFTSRASLDRSSDWVDERLRSVQIGAPPGVTLSSASGDFVATVTNRLDQPVTVSVEARSDSGIRITPPEPVELAPKSRTSVLLQARTPEASVHNVTLLLTDLEGTPLGSSDRLPIRSAQVSNVIWVIMGTGVLLLFGAILVRLVRRLRRRGHDGHDGDGDSATAEPTPTPAGTNP
jgi:hypothetical protein